VCASVTKDQRRLFTTGGRSRVMTPPLSSAPSNPPGAGKFGGGRGGDGSLERHIRSGIRRTRRSDLRGQCDRGLDDDRVLRQPDVRSRSRYDWERRGGKSRRPNAPRAGDFTVAGLLKFGRGRGGSAGETLLNWSKTF